MAFIYLINHDLGKKRLLIGMSRCSGTVHFSEKPGFPLQQIPLSLLPSDVVTALGKIPVAAR
jgi:hypothetical protein